MAGSADGMAAPSSLASGSPSVEAASLRHRKLSCREPRSMRSSVLRSESTSIRLS
jgi:hypothetical protein